MKRHPALHPLSREHHHFLMWCRNVRWYVEKSPRAPDLDTLLLEVKGQLPYIDAHFEIEETRLFPVCEMAVGERVQPHLTRLRADHIRWRTHISHALAIARTDIQLLATLAQHLHNHIRYEERLFFPLLQALLTETDWQDLTKQLG